MSYKSDISKRQISGPVNVFRLESPNTTKKRKVVYIFVNILVDANNQSSCTNPFSESIDKWIVNTISKNKSSYDFYMDGMPKAYDTPNNYYFDTYQMINSMSDKFKNILFYNFRFYNYLTDILDTFNMIIINPSDTSNSQILQKYLSNVSEFSKMLNLYLNGKPPKEKSKDDYIIFLSHMLDDLLKKYNNTTTIQSDMVSILKNKLLNLVDWINWCIDTISEQEKYVSDFDNNIHPNKDCRSWPQISTSIKNKIELSRAKISAVLWTKYINIMSTIITIDSTNHILNSKIEVGLYNLNCFSAAYLIYNLCKNFDFNITHCTDVRYTDLKELKKNIIKANLTDLPSFVLPTNVIQCSDLTNFPKDIN